MLAMSYSNSNTGNVIFHRDGHYVLLHCPLDEAAAKASALQFYSLLKSAGGPDHFMARFGEISVLVDPSAWTNLPRDVIIDVVAKDDETKQSTMLAPTKAHADSKRKSVARMHPPITQQSGAHASTKSGTGSKHHGKKHDVTPASELKATEPEKVTGVEQVAAQPQSENAAIVQSPLQSSTNTEPISQPEAATNDTPVDVQIHLSEPTDQRPASTEFPVSATPTIEADDVMIPVKPEADIQTIPVAPIPQAVAAAVEPLQQTATPEPQPLQQTANAAAATPTPQPSQVVASAAVVPPAAPVPTTVEATTPTPLAPTPSVPVEAQATQPLRTRRAPHVRATLDKLNGDSDISAVDEGPSNPEVDMMSILTPKSTPEAAPAQMPTQEVRPTPTPVQSVLNPAVPQAVESSDAAAAAKPRRPVIFEVTLIPDFKLGHETSTVVDSRRPLATLFAFIAQRFDLPRDNITLQHIRSDGTLVPLPSTALGSIIDRDFGQRIKVSCAEARPASLLTSSRMRPRMATPSMPARARGSTGGPLGPMGPLGPLRKGSAAYSSWAAQNAAPTLPSGPGAMRSMRPMPSSRDSTQSLMSGPRPAISPYATVDPNVAVATRMHMMNAQDSRRVVSMAYGAPDNNVPSMT